jgi:hypothetical protein
MTVPLLLACVFPLTLIAQVADTLKYAISPPPVFQVGSQLGYSVAIDGGRTVVGAPYDDTSAVDSGIAKVFDSTTGGLLHVLQPFDGQASDYFGAAVAISGNRVAVGAYGRRLGVRTEVGRVLIYNLTSATPTVPTLEVRSSDYTRAQFGYSVAISGARLVVGAPGHNGSGGVFVYDLNSATPTTYTHLLPAPRPAGSFPNFGISVSLNGTRIAVGAPYNASGQEIYAGNAFVYDLALPDPTVPWLTLSDPSPTSAENFGFSVAISNTHAVVGSPGTSMNVNNVGAVYAFALTPSPTPIQLTPPTQAFSARYVGYSVAISGSSVLVGAPLDHSSASSAGLVYQYNVSGSNPGISVRSIYSPTPAALDRFGHAVAISGTRAAIGAPQDDTGAMDAGSAYGYQLTGPNGGFAIATFNDTGPATDESFGGALAVSGTRMAVGNQLDDTGAPDAGRVAIYDFLTPTHSIPVLLLANPEPASGDRFGNAVAMSGRRIVVGACRDDFSVSNAGSVYIYDLDGVAPNAPTLTLRNPGPASNDNFGFSVALAGTIVVIGTPNDNTDGSDSGIAYVYNLKSATPATPVATLANPNAGTGKFFGFAVAASGDRVVIGASAENGGGKAYVYELSSATPTVPVFVLHNPSPQLGDGFGSAVAMSAGRVIVGSPGDDDDASNAGKAYVYDLTSDDPTTPSAILRNPSPNSDDAYGFAVALSRNHAVIGAYGADSAETNAGLAYVYDLSGISPVVPVATLSKPSQKPDDQFGYAVGLDGATVAVGAPLDDTVARDKGFTYVFAPSNSDIDNDGLLDVWECASFGSITSQGALDDTDDDGCVEILELAFDRDPINGDPGRNVRAINEGGYLTVSLARRSGVSYLVESASLPEESSFSSTMTTVLVNSPTILKVRDNVPISSGVARFLRVKITAAP